MAAYLRFMQKLRIVTFERCEIVKIPRECVSRLAMSFDIKPFRNEIFKS